MLKLNLSSDPRWIDLTSGVRLKVKPLSSCLGRHGLADDCDSWRFILVTRW